MCSLYLRSVALVGNNVKDEKSVLSIDIHQTMFIAISDIDLFQFESIHDFVSNCLISVEQIRQLFDDNQGNFPLPIQLEQFVLDHILQSNKRETFRDESLIDLYTSFLNDLLHWSTFTHKQIVCILTLIQGLLCQIERKDMKLNEAFIHACSILMSGNDNKKPVLFNAQQYPKIIDYIIQTVFQHRHLYETLLDEEPQQIEKIEENRAVKKKEFLNFLIWFFFLDRFSCIRRTTFSLSINRSSTFIYLS
jgi:hypothetical protein